MNVAYFLTPRSEVGCIYDDQTLRQGLEKMRRSGYTALPVVTRQNQYIGTVSEGDFLWYLADNSAEAELKKTNLHDLEHVPMRKVPRRERNAPVRITAGIEELLERAMNQNFVPVIDDRGLFIGIVTRKDILQYLTRRAGCRENAQPNTGEPLRHAIG